MLHKNQEVFGGYDDFLVPVIFVRMYTERNRCVKFFSRISHLEFEKQNHKQLFDQPGKHSVETL